MVDKFGQTLRKLREEKKMTQKEVVDIINVSVQAYSRYETNACEPCLQTLIALADFYNVTIDSLLR